MDHFRSLHALCTLHSQPGFSVTACLAVDDGDEGATTTTTTTTTTII
jgi:hypothetical protein